MKCLHTIITACHQKSIRCPKNDYTHSYRKTKQSHYLPTCATFVCPQYNQSQSWDHFSFQCIDIPTVRCVSEQLPPQSFVDTCPTNIAEISTSLLIMVSYFDDSQSFKSSFRISAGSNEWFLILNVRSKGDRKNVR